MAHKQTWSTVGDLQSSEVCPAEPPSPPVFLDRGDRGALWYGSIDPGDKEENESVTRRREHHYYTQMYEYMYSLFEILFCDTFGYVLDLFIPTLSEIEKSIAIYI